MLDDGPWYDDLILDHEKNFDGFRSMEMYLTILSDIQWVKI